MPGGPFRNSDELPVYPAMLLHDDGVETFGQWRASQDAHGACRWVGDVLHAIAGSAASRDFQGPWTIALKISAAQGVAVHGRIVERRKVEERMDWLAGNSSAGSDQVQRFRVGHGSGNCHGARCRYIG